MDNELDSTNNNISIDPEELKIVVGQIKKSIFDLKSAKEKADDAWNLSRDSLKDVIVKDIDLKRETVKTTFDRAIENLEMYSNKLDSVSNIWKDTETEIMSTSKKVEQILNSIKTGFDSFDKFK